VVGEKTFAKHQSQPDLLIGAFLDLEEGLLLFDQHFLGKGRVGHNMRHTRPDAEPDNVTIILPGLLHSIDQAITAEVP
jgi:hypothetical protein